MSAFDVKAVAAAIQAYTHAGLENHPDPDLSENVHNELPSLTKTVPL